jgi:hypothetical protein
LAQTVGAKPPLHLPTWLGRLLAGDAGVRMMTATSGVSNAKARLMLDWKLKWPSWREGFRHALLNPQEHDRRAA